MEIFLLAGMRACAKSFDIDGGNILEWLKSGLIYCFCLISKQLFSLKSHTLWGAIQWQVYNNKVKCVTEKLPENMRYRC